MRAHVAAIKAQLESAGRQVYVVDVPEGVVPTFPYYLIWATTGDERSDSLCNTDRYIDTEVGVTNVGLTPDSVWAVSATSRGLLQDWSPVVEGRAVHPLDRTEARAVLPDRDVTLPNTNRHPYYGVDLYRLISEPA